MTSLQTGKADLAVAGISATDERKEVFDFSIPYYENKISFLVRKADVEKYKDLTSLESANIAAQKGTVPESMVKEQLPKVQLTSLTNMGEAVNELQTGKIDAVHMDEPVALSYAAKNAGLAVATVSLKMKDGDANAVALRKNSDDLKEVVDKVIQKLKDEGTYQSYLEKAASLTEVEE
ncbi:ABC transporter substrate-binding lipoprotein [Streptococcus pneumoniae]|nr:ABC transporter substrate-binding lipoprotein [Streptococcus pneumoniae]CWK64863.1 ABC transporter substrate-binding lipoprotein [Streptococcus pneumoniae]